MGQKVRLDKICPCGSTFQIYPYEKDRAKYCSKKCLYKFRVRPTGVIKPVYLKPNPGWFSSGQEPHNKGKNLSVEQVEKMIIAMTGRRLSPRTEFKPGVRPWNKDKDYIAIRGARHHNWQGGITELNSKIRGCIEYKLWRTQVFQRDNYTCQLCGAKGYLNADHIKPFSKFPELRFDVNNGRTLCVPCHRQTDTYGGRCK